MVLYCVGAGVCHVHCTETVQVTATVMPTCTVSESRVIQQTETVTATLTNFGELCTGLPLTNTSNELQTGNTAVAAFGVGSIIAVVLGVILLVQLIACTVAWVVCLRRKQGRMKAEGIGTLV